MSVTPRYERTTYRGRYTTFWVWEKRPCGHRPLQASDTTSCPRVGWLVVFFWASIYGRYPTSIPNGPSAAAKWAPLSAAAASSSSSWWFTLLSEGHPPPPPTSLISNLSFPSQRIGRSSPPTDRALPAPFAVWHQLLPPPARPIVHQAQSINRSPSFSVSAGDIRRRKIVLSVSHQEA